MKYMYDTAFLYVLLVLFAGQSISELSRGEAGKNENNLYIPTIKYTCLCNFVNKGMNPLLRKS